MSGPGARVLELQVGNDPAMLAGVLDEVDGFLRALRIATESRAKAMLIVDELASNVARHAWPDGGTHSFLLRLSAGPGRAELRLTIELEDDGIAFDPSAVPPADTGGPLDARQEGGLGWLLVRSMADGFAHHRADGRNHLVVRTQARLA